MRGKPFWFIVCIPVQFVNKLSQYITEPRSRSLRILSGDGADYLRRSPTKDARAKSRRVSLIETTRSELCNGSRPDFLTRRFLFDLHGQPMPNTKRTKPI